jgi:hypothetical protein
LAASGACAQAGEATAGLSVVEIPVRIALDPLLAEIERLTPREAGHWREWKETQGVETRYRAWRGPLAFQVQGQTLRVSAHVRYWVRARARLLNAIELEADCGVDEPPRQAVIGVAARLEWGPDWTLHPRFRVLPTRFLDGCEMTVADLDVTPLIGPVFERELRLAIARALAGQRTARASFREQAARVWESLHRPIELAPALWLRLRPLAVAMAPPEGGGREATVRVGLALRPQLVHGARPAGQTAPLPPLGRLPPGHRGLAFNLEIELDWDAAAERLTDALAGTRLEVEGRDLEIRGIRLSGRGPEVTAHVELGGAAGGDLEIWARPAVVPGEAPLRLEDLEYLYHPHDPLIGLAAESVYERVRALLEEAANGVLAERLDEAAARIRDGLASALPAAAQVDLDSLSVEAGAVRVRETGVTLEGTAAGGLKLRFDAAAGGSPDARPRM